MDSIQQLPTDEQLRAIVASSNAKTREYTQQFLKLMGGFVMVVGLSDGNVPLEGAFDDPDLLIAALNDLDISKKYNVYLTLNELDPANPPGIAKLGINRLHTARKGESCTNANILRRRRILIDLDRTEELKKLGPATVEEKQKIYVRAQAVSRFLTEHGIGAAPYIAQADSGNGFHLLISVDMPNGETETRLVQRFLEALALKFDGDGVEIDTKVFDAKRITRAYGSWNRKGTATKERPHRRSRLFPPDPMFGKEGPVTAQQLEAVIAAIASTPKADSTTNNARGPATIADLKAWCERYGQQLEDGVEGQWLAIQNPACRGRHGDKHPHTTATRLAVLDGHIRFQCHHASCEQMTWTDYRLIVEAAREPYLFPWESEEALIEEPMPVMAYPIEVWNDTLYGEYADECSKGNYIPKEFHVESLKTVVSAIAGRQLYGNDQGSKSAKQYTILVGPISSGKGTAIRQAVELFAYDWEVGITGESADLIWGSGTTPKNKFIGAVRANAASEPALYEAGMLCPRVLLTPAELDGLLEKTHIQGSGAALLSQFRELFDSSLVSASTTAKRSMKDVPKVIDLSLLTSTQPAVFDELMSVSGGLGTGFASRCTLVSSTETRTVPRIPTPNLRRVKTELARKLEALETQPFSVNISPEADAVLVEWDSNIREIARRHETDQQREITARLNIIVLRNALHLAWLLDEKTISAETMRKATRLGDYQLSQRQALFGVPADNPLAMMQQKIVRALRKFGRSSRNKLSDRTNARRSGTRIFNEAVEGLRKEGIVLELKGNRANQKLYALRKESTE